MYSFSYLEPVCCSMSSSNCSWPAYWFLKRQVRWSGIPISSRIFQTFLYICMSVVVWVWEAWCAAIHRVSKRQTLLSSWTELIHSPKWFVPNILKTKHLQCLPHSGCFSAPSWWCFFPSLVLLLKWILNRKSRDSDSSLSSFTVWSWESHTVSSMK